LKVTADGHDLMIPQHTMRPSIACVSEHYKVFTRSSKRPANVQQLARVFWIHLMEVCWIV